MTSDQIQLIKATVPVLREHGVLLTSHFYKRMFEYNPELKHIFNTGNQQNNKQQTALAMAVLAYAEYIETPEVLLPVVDHIGHKHTSLDIRPEHYTNLDMCGIYKIDSFTLAQALHFYKQHKHNSTSRLKFNKANIRGHAREQIFQMR